MKTLTVRRSQNSKTGPVALATYRPQITCPTDCAFMGSGCYGENKGGLLFQHAERGTDLDQLRAQIRLLRRGEIVRLNVVGDYLLEDGTPDHEYIATTNEIPTFVDVLSYTHAWRQLEPGWFRDHVRPNASCETVAGVAQALSVGWQAVIVDDGQLGDEKIAGMQPVACPFETKKRQCIDCRLCARWKRSSVVVFQAHGVQKKKAKAAVQQRRDMEVYA